MIESSRSVSEIVPIVAYSDRLAPRNPVVARLVTALSSAFVLHDARSLAALLRVPVEQEVGMVLQWWILRCFLEIDEGQAALLLPKLVAQLDEILAGRGEA